MPTCYIFRGPPATGKSTRRQEMGLNYVNLDELREANPTLKEHQVQERQQEQIKLFVQAGVDYIVDNTNLNPKTLNRHKTFAEQNGYDVEIVDFGHDVSWHTAALRDQSRAKKVGASVIWKYYVDAGIHPVDTLEQIFVPRCAIMVDVDGTIADIEHRRKHVRSFPKNWKAFFNEMYDDEPRRDVLGEIFSEHSRLRHYYQNSPWIILCSGRPSEYRRTTELWLLQHGISYDLLLMRGYNDSRKDDIVKRELYQTYIEPYFNVLNVFDDRPSVIRMWQELGLTVTDCGDGEDF